MMEEQMKLDNYEVVRQDYVAEQEKIQLTFHRGRVYVNSYCIKQYPNHDYIQILVEKEEKKVAIKLLNQRIKDSFKWSTNGKKRRPRHIGCMPLYYSIYSMMGWDLNSRYRITGEVKSINEQTVLCFRLEDAICYTITKELDENGRMIVNCTFPKNWEMNFGIKQMDYELDEFIRTFEEDEIYKVQLRMNGKNIERIKECEDNDE